MSEKYKTLNDLKDIGKLFGIESSDENETIGFLGRYEEFIKIKTFLSSQQRILEICGVPMIGKTSLTKEFCEKHNFSNIRIVFTNSQLPKITLQNDLFKHREWNDFSDFNSNTLIIIENFENALEWTPKNDHLHEVVADKIHDFINGVLQSGLKIILESRFQIRFGSEQRYFLQTYYLKPIPTSFFWEYYKTKGFTEQDFETVCQKFDEHTGLLAIAYNDASWLYENELTKAIYEPSATLKNLWNLLEVIIKKLQKPERQLLATLTLLQKPISKIDLKEYLSPLIKNADIDKYLESLRKKLLATSSLIAEYSINPYIAEVCFTFFEKTAEVLELKKLPAFKDTPLPDYNKIKQASDKGDYSTFYRLVKELRKNRKYDEVHQILKYALEYDNIINKSGVLNEIGVTYKFQKKYSEAKQVLEKACKLGNIHSYNELSIIYKEEKNYTKSIQILEEALQIEPNNIKILNELAIDYKGEKKYSEAKQILEKILKINDSDVKTLNELAIVYKEESKYFEAMQVLEKALKIDPKNVKVLNELAIVFKKERKYIEARQVLEKALNIAPHDAFLINNLEDLEKKIIMQAENSKTDLSEMPKLTKVFISHSSKDKYYVANIIEIIETIGVSSENIFCSSFEGYGVRLGENFLERIKTELNSDVLVIFVLSKNFYNSPISLCEMGATWVKTTIHVPILIPPFNYQDVEGVFPQTHSMKINEREKYNTLKELIEKRFNLPPKSSSIWENKRNKAITDIERLINENNTVS